MASQFRFLKTFVSVRKFWSFLVVAAMKRTPSTFCSFRRNSGVPSSDSVFVLWSIVAKIPSVIMLWLASSGICCVFVMVGGSTFGTSSSWLQWFGSTRLTRYSYVSWTSMESSVWMAATIPIPSVCAACVVVFFRVADNCLFLIDGVLVDVVSSLNTIFGDFCCCFGFDENSRASLTFIVDGGVVAGLCFQAAAGRLWGWTDFPL